MQAECRVVDSPWHHGNRAARREPPLATFMPIALLLFVGDRDQVNPHRLYAAVQRRDVFVPD